MPVSRPSLLSLAPLSLLLAGPALAQAQAQPASQAQVGQIDKRVGALESQMRAVQRQVFPGGDKRFFAPEVTPEAAPATPAPGTPATSPLVDLSQRVTALETQQRSLTGQVEELQFRLRQMEGQLAKLQSDSGARLDALEGKGGAAPAVVPMAAAPVTASPAARPPAKSPPAAAGVAAAAAQPGAALPGAQAGAQPGAATPAVDPVVARYEAAYSLYEKGDWVAAEKALRAFAQANPKHPRASNASYWAGRSLMQQQLPGEAARVFYAGYQNAPKGQRAHNSLLWLAKALLQTEGPKAQKAACDTLDQLEKAFPDKLTGAFAAETATTRAQAKCTG
jgi:TolA-binding protein